MSWDACQREMLAALGHTLYVPVSADTAAMPLEDKAEVLGPARSVQDSASPHALMHALLRAANLGEREARVLQSRLPPLDTIADNALAKRKCWPTLRALRAQRPA